MGKALAKRAKSGPLLQRVLERPFFEEAFNELRCKDLDVEEFYHELKMELTNENTGEVEIYCPFTGKHRWEKIKSQLTDALARGVQMTVYINSIENHFVRNKKFHQEVIDWLKTKGIDVFDFKFMHQKGVFFDNRLAYVGSLNVLSFSPLGKETTDIMLRFDVPQVVKALKVAFQGMLGGNDP